MNRIACDITNEQVPSNPDDPESATRPGVRAKCSDCGHVTESFGQGDPSRKRCLALMAESCPEAAKDRVRGRKPTRNFYTDGSVEASQRGYQTRGDPDPKPKPWWEK